MPAAIVEEVKQGRRGLSKSRGTSDAMGDENNNALYCKGREGAGDEHFRCLRGFSQSIVSRMCILSWPPEAAWSCHRSESLR